MALTRSARIVLLLCVIALALAYLRDPPWLLSYNHGLRAWEVDADGKRVRWTGGHAAFHVPADVRSLTVPARSLKDNPTDWPITALITIDDRPTERVTFQDESWRTITLRLPAPGSRRTRRIDIRLDRVYAGNRGLQLGEVELRR